jgi:putative ABC transport system substrate-binding protein
MAAGADDPEYQARMAAFQQGLEQLGWTEGRNARIDIRWATTNADEIRKHAGELAALAPDVILAATGTTTVAPLLEATRTVRIVFVLVIDRSAPASSRAWRGRAAMPPASSCSNSA